MQYMYDAVEGEKVPGAIVTRPVAEYEIDGRPVYSYTTVVLGMTNEPSFESQVRAAFKSAGHEIEEKSAESTPTERVSAVQQTILEPAEEDAAF